MEGSKRYVRLLTFSFYRKSHDEHPDRDNLCNAIDDIWKKCFSRCFFYSDDVLMFIVLFDYTRTA